LEDGSMLSVLIGIEVFIKIAVLTTNVL